MNKVNPNKLIIGLTGGIASGKSVAAEVFCACGYKIVDADVLSREVLNQKNVLDKLEKRFPSCFGGGVLNRARLRERVFNNKDDLNFLNSLTHKSIYGRAEELLKECKGPAVFVNPLLFETVEDFGQGLYTHIITISCPEEERISRIVKRDNITVEAARKIIRAQLSDAEREKKAGFILHNCGGGEAFKEEVKKLALKLLIKI